MYQLTYCSYLLKYCKFDSRIYCELFISTFLKSKPKNSVQLIRKDVLVGSVARKLGMTGEGSRLSDSSSKLWRIVVRLKRGNMTEIRKKALERAKIYVSFSDEESFYRSFDKSFPVLYDFVLSCFKWNLINMRKRRKLIQDHKKLQSEIRFLIS